VRKVVVGLVFLLFLVACGGYNGSDYSPAPAAAADHAPAPPQSQVARERLETGGTLEFNLHTETALRGAAVSAPDENWVGDFQEDDMAFEQFPFGGSPSEDGFPAEVTAEISNDDAPQQVQRIIQTASVQMESYDFDDTVNRLRAIVVDMDGFVEVSDIWAERWQGAERRFFSATLRIPVADFDEALWRVENTAYVVSSSQRAQNVTAEFYDTASRLSTRRIEEERILALIENVESLSQLLSLEQRLGQVRTQIELYQSRLDALAHRAAYSTIIVWVMERFPAEEVEEEEEEEVLIIPTLGDRISDAFVTSFDATMGFVQNVLIFLAGVIVPLTVLAVIILTGVKVARFAQAKRKPVE
jgi:hypothetical protein